MPIGDCGGNGAREIEMPEMTIQQALELAVQHHQAGRLGEARDDRSLPLSRQLDEA